MTTEIKKRITGKQMTTAFFDNDKNNNIRNYRAINFDENNGKASCEAWLDCSQVLLKQN